MHLFLIHNSQPVWFVGKGKGKRDVERYDIIESNMTLCTMTLAVKTTYGKEKK